MAPRFAAPDTEGSSTQPVHHVQPPGVAVLANRQALTLDRHGLTADESLRLDRALLGVVRASGPLPSLKQLAAMARISRCRLRRTIGTVEAAADAVVDERISTARRCAAMPSRWYPALAELSSDIVTHRLYIQRIVADVLADGRRRLPTAALLSELATMLDDDLSYNIRRLGVLDEPSDIRAFVADVGALLSFERLAELCHSTADDRQLIHRLTTEVQVDMTRYCMFERWCDRRHDWFSTDVAATPIAS